MTTIKAKKKPYRQAAKPARKPPTTAAERVAAQVNRGNCVTLQPCADPERRARLEADPVAWLQWYLHQTYTRPFERPHREIVAGVLRAHETGGRFVVAAERGIGKSAILWGMVLLLALTGRRRFPVCVPWADRALKRAFRFWRNALCFNERLLADYPEFCLPFAHAKGTPQKVCNVWWEHSGRKTGAQLTVGEGLIVLPDQRGCIGGSTINANVRGLNHPMEDGTILRPDIVLLDDVQDRSVAKSPAQVADTVSIIDGDVAGCGDSGKDLPLLMAANCIGPEDVAQHYLNNKDWHALKIPCIVRWPADWDEPDSRTRALWAEWHEAFQAGGDERAQAFFDSHRAELVNGMELSAPAAFAVSGKCADPFYGVIKMFHRMGREAFMAERQQEPIDQIAEAGPYHLTADVVLRRVDAQRKPLERPQWVTRVLASSDVNPSYGFSSVVLGFGEDQSAVVLWYGIHKLAIPGDLPALELGRRLFAELTAHGKALAGLPVGVEQWAIDAGGGNFDGVLAFAAAASRVCGIPAFGFTGRGAKNYRQTGKTAAGPFREQCHGCLDHKDGRAIRWVAWNSDFWKECAQRAWLGEIGAPGALSLPAGIHGEFAAQVTNERLLGKGDVGGQTFWNFKRLPGRNDFGDALAQGYALAAFGFGIGTSGRQRIGQARRPKPSIRMVKMR